MDTFSLLFGGVCLLILFALFVTRKSEEVRHDEEKNGKCEDMI
ncbi:hypothetical protein [Sulfuricurvum sp. PD_MW2]|jgi:hypothetical protein|nr:hypothetical protein [Sulfuricurvum sp. PD_MW2]